MIEKEKLTEDEIISNYNEFITFISSNFEGERKTNLLKMYSPEELGEEMCIAPASLRKCFHLSFPGGYIIHVMRVVKSSFEVKKLYQSMGGEIDFTDEEMIFSALHHDLGKLGDKEFGPYYVVEDNSWKLSQGIPYKLNPNLQYMEVTDRAVYTLQKYGVKYSWKEYLGIKLADGMYKESAKSYLAGFNEEVRLKTSLPRIIHIADYISAHSEYDMFKRGDLSDRSLPIIMNKIF